MAGLISELLDSIKEQAEFFEHLLALSVEKKDAILKNDIKELKKITSVENIIVSKNSKLEKKININIKDIAMVLNQDENINIEHVLLLIKNQPEHDCLKELIEKMMKNVNILREVNEQNKLLTLSALDYIDFSLNICRNTSTLETDNYSNKHASLGNSNIFFDAKQ